LADNLYVFSNVFYVFSRVVVAYIQCRCIHRSWVSKQTGKNRKLTTYSSFTLLSLYLLFALVVVVVYFLFISWQEKAIKS